jgi:hypothetical protein
MKKLAIAILATTVLGTPAVFAASNDNQQQPQNQQMQHGQDQNQKGQQNQTGQNSQNQQGQQNNQQAAQNDQPIATHNLSRGEIREVQQALDKDGFKAGPTDGRWGAKTASAVKQFQRSKQLQATGRLNQQTVADLGLDASQFSQSQNQQK